MGEGTDRGQRGGAPLLHSSLGSPGEDTGPTRWEQGAWAQRTAAWRVSPVGTPTPDRVCPECPFMC